MEYNVTNYFSFSFCIWIVTIRNGSNFSYCDAYMIEVGGTGGYGV